MGQQVFQHTLPNGLVLLAEAALAGIEEETTGADYEKGDVEVTPRGE